MTRVIRQLTHIRQHAADALKNTSAPNSCLWNLLVRPIADHLLALADERTAVAEELLHRRSSFRHEYLRQISVVREKPFSLRPDY
jgi:hypothetical protein